MDAGVAPTDDTKVLDSSDNVATKPATKSDLRHSQRKKLSAAATAKRSAAKDAGTEGTNGAFATPDGNRDDMALDAILKTTTKAKPSLRRSQVHLAKDAAEAKNAVAEDVGDTPEPSCHSRKRKAKEDIKDLSKDGKTKAVEPTHNNLESDKVKKACFSWLPEPEIARGISQEDFMILKERASHSETGVMAGFLADLKSLEKGIDPYPL
ncbi:hypothetical protein N7495_004480 [Penicillium taxi]|uniref:uncharacterized protein n=1 Tax=Penicillium taxi TaxID=168475 RepID=UPI002545A7F8|nr:uncharacterized protein N7495_004480 [Penicillium taxi]KAJ5899736.1 hypothetical protein N7495_004480 [Penicillium taxi]